MTDSINRLKDLLLDLPEIKCAEHVKSVPSAVTTAWGEEVGTIKNQVEIVYKTWLMDVLSQILK